MAPFGSMQFQLSQGIELQRGLRSVWMFASHTCRPSARAGRTSQKQKYQCKIIQRATSVNILMLGNKDGADDGVIQANPDQMFREIS